MIYIVETHADGQVTATEAFSDGFGRLVQRPERRVTLVADEPTMPSNVAATAAEALQALMPEDD